MNIKNAICMLSTAALIAGCAGTGTPLNDEQIGIINTHKIVVKSVPESEQELLAIYTGDQTVGANVAGVALGLFTGSIGFNSGGDTPRTRFPENGMNDLIKNTMRKNSATEVKTVIPSQLIEHYFAERFDVVDDDEKKQLDQLTIQVEPVTWHFFYEELLQDKPTYFLEYAADVDISLPDASIHRIMTCDKQSKKALPEQDWFSNDALRIRKFADELAIECVNKVFSELKQPLISPVAPIPAADAEEKKAPLLYRTNEKLSSK